MSKKIKKGNVDVYPYESMIMKGMLPAEVKVGAHTYEVKYPHKFKETEKHTAFVSLATKTILISDVDRNGNKIPQSVVLVDFIHELLHIIEEETQFKVFEKFGDREENAVQAFANCIGQILIDNKWV